MNVTRDVSDVTHRKRGLRFEKSQLVEFLPREKTVDFRGSLKPGQWPCGRYRTWFGADGKVSIERWYLSPYVEKPFNSKLIKSFVPELRSRKCFTCFGIPMFYIYIYMSMNILCTFRISVSWVCYMLYKHICIYTHIHAEYILTQ